MCELPVLYHTYFSRTNLEKLKTETSIKMFLQCFFEPEKSVSFNKNAIDIASFNYFRFTFDASV